MEYEIEKVDLSKIVDKVINDLTESASEKGTKLILSGEPNMQAMIDPGKFEQIMINLVGNSLKFTDRGTIMIIFTRDGGEVKIEVRDIGTGIAPENQSLLFHNSNRQGRVQSLEMDQKVPGLRAIYLAFDGRGMGGKLELVSVLNWEREYIWYQFTNSK